MKHLRMLGLGLMAALSLMAFVGATQASALWLESGATIASNLPGNAKIVGLEPATEGGTAGAVHGVLEVPAKELEILCAEGKANEGQLLSGTVLVSGILEFSKCETFQKKVLSKGCTPKEPIVTTKILAHLILHPTGELTYALLEPESGTKFALIDFNEETCALPDTEVTGSVVAECLGEKYELMKNNPTVDYCLQELANHLITEAPRALFTKEEGGKKVGDILKYGANEAFIKGVLNVFLNTGNKWSGHV